ncbi:MAG: peptidoglycan-binding protein [Candidatus Omnitrophica bacterium]|nr:peptidoglycan-binding protein [Candidatus Omnitrophota bacterium]
MIGQGRTGWWVAGICAAFVLTSVGYGMGRRAAMRAMGSSIGVTPAGAPLPTIQIEPIQPQEELAAIGGFEPAAGAGPADAASVQAQAALPAITGGASADSLQGGQARVRDVQVALRAAGFDPGSADGRMGPRTRQAVRDFQVANGLQPDGKVGARTWAKLETFLKQEIKQETR